MKKMYGRLKFWLKFDHGRSFFALPIGIISFLILFKLVNVIWIDIVLSIIIVIVSMIIIQIRNINNYASEYLEFNKKDRYIEPDELRGYSKNIDDILDLDKELTDFLDKYSSGKEEDYFEKELNKQWEKHGDKFIKRADKLLKKMSNQELMYTLLGTESIKDIVRVIDYFKPYKINLEYLIEHPEKSKEYYYDNLLQQDAIRHNAINEYYFRIIMDLNYFEEIERFILSQMSNQELMKLADSSKDWQEKLYYYGFLKK